MKKVLKFQLKDIYLSLSIFYLIMIILLFIGNIQFTLVSESHSVMVNGTGFSTAIFCFVLGICIFREHFCFFIQNGISRKLYFKGTLCTIAVIGIIITVMESILTLLLILTSPNNVNYKVSNTIYYIYSEYFHKIDGAGSLIITLILNTLLSILLFIIGYLIASIFYRSGKIMKVVVSAGLPITAVVLIQISSIHFPEIWKKIGDLMQIIFGIKDQNPFIALATICIILVIFISICYQVLKKAEI